MGIRIKTGIGIDNSTTVVEVSEKESKIDLSNELELNTGHIAELEIVLEFVHFRLTAFVRAGSTN